MAVTLDVRRFGAAGDGLKLDSDAINAAILAAQPGDTVLFPPGTYLSYSIRLKSDLTLRLERGAVILAAGDPPPGHEVILAMLTADGILPGGGTGDSGSFYAGDQFGLDHPPAAEEKNNVTPPPKKAAKNALSFEMPPRKAGEPTYDLPEPNEHDKYQDHGHSHWHNSLIWGVGLERVTIEGPGMIDGRGLTWNADPANPTGNKAIALKECRGVVLKGFTIFRGGHFALLATGCENVRIERLTLDTNRDGLDIDCCKDVHISHCAINSPNDDGIVLKSGYSLGRAVPTEDVVIRDCQLSGFDMGTLIDGTRKTTQTIAPDRGGVTGRIKFGTESNGGFKRVLITDCKFEHCRGLALETVDGGIMEDIEVTNLVMRDITTAPLFIRLGNRARGPAGTPVGIARRISISNVRVEDAEPRYACLFSGVPGHSIEELELSNIQISYRGGGGLMDAAAEPGEKEGAYPEPNMFGVIPAYGLYCRHGKGLKVRDVAVTFEKDEKRPPVVLVDVENASFEKFSARRREGVSFIVLREVRGLKM